MKQCIKFSSGAEFRMTDTGYIMIATNGSRTEFDSIGKLVEDAWLKYFDTMGYEERNAVSRWISEQIANTEAQRRFLNLVREALRYINYEYRIANIEPSMDQKGNIYYEKGREVAVGLTFWEWENKAKKFNPKYRSKLATLNELFLWYAYRVARGDWTLEAICNDYRNPIRKIELSGTRKIGGALDGVRNTLKIVRDTGGLIVYCGDCFDFDMHQAITKIRYEEMSDIRTFAGTGVIVVSK